MAVTGHVIQVSYNTDGVSQTFAFPPYFRSAADLVVQYLDSSSVLHNLLLGTDYNVTGTLDPKLNVYSNGGSVVTTGVLAGGGTITIQRTTPEAQPYVFQPNDPFPAGSIEGSLDAMELQIQELAGLIASTISVFAGSGPSYPTSTSFPQFSLWRAVPAVPGGPWAWILIGTAWYGIAGISL